MQTTITRVDAITMRKTSCILPGYGATSSLSHSKNQLDWLPETGKPCAVGAISVPAHDDDGGFAQPEEFLRWICDAHSHGKTRCKMNPVKGPLHIRKAWLQSLRIPAMPIANSN